MKFSTSSVWFISLLFLPFNFIVNTTDSLGDNNFSKKVKKKLQKIIKRSEDI